ncbi:MAG: pyruvate kinase [Alphaproteobacteria bacterium]|nr:MAG: pyruvate kinase [Alphaproteobacteria bacterium]
MSRRTKIVTTIGPASSSMEMIERFFDLGVNVFRLNFSHGTHQDHFDVVKKIRTVEKHKNKIVAILADLQGPKLRVGKFKSSPISLKEGQQFRLDLDSELGDQNRVPFPHPEVIESLDVGHRLLLDDGKIRLRVTRVNDQSIETIVEVSGQLSNNKGVNIPDTNLKKSALTEKDLKDIEFIKTLDVDYVAQSFVQSALDVKALRALIGNQYKIIAKIEKPQALLEIDEIITISDGIMVARGDLGVEMDLAHVPITQKSLVAKARENYKPVIVATQMLESMIQASTPTRAEVSDVANAVFDGADAVMLSAESAAGQYPSEAVYIMSQILEATESDPIYQTSMMDVKGEPVLPSQAMAAAAHHLAENMQACAIICSTLTGATALRVAHFRGHIPIYAMTPDMKTARSLSLIWGVSSVMCQGHDRFDQFIDEAFSYILKQNIACSGDKVIVTGGSPVGRAGQTNLIQVLEID